MSDDRYIDCLRMPQSATDAMAGAVPDDLVRVIRRHYRRTAPTPPAPKAVVDSLVERFAPKAD
jgi:hypothetical protein